VDHHSFRDQLAFSIGFAVTRSRELLRRILKEHAPDDARQQLAARVIEHLEQSGFEIDEAEQVLRKRPPGRNHG
jgi:transposase